ncbi:hypothetical protein S83_020832, partial [Arachis hypogaea]
TDGTIKTIRLKVKEIDNLSRDEQVVVNFEDQQAIEKSQGPLDIPRSRFKECFSNLLKEMCRRNKEVRKKQTIPHTGGSKPISRKRHEIEQIELLMTQNEKDESGSSTNNAIGKLFGEEHSGRVRCLGMGATPTNTFSQFANTSISMSSTNYSQADFKCLESKFDGTLTVLKAYFLSKEGRISAELTSIFDHGAQ